MTKSKSLSQRNEKELLEIFASFDIPAPDPKDTTVEDLRTILKEKGIDNKALRAWEDKQDNKLDIEEYDGKNPEDTKGDVIVGMRRKNAFFEYRGHKFTRDRPYVPMSQEDAYALIQRYDGFYQASREEVKRYYS